MPYTLPAPRLSIPLEPLTPQAFAPFGTVIQNSTTDITKALSSNPAALPPNASIANQGTALKFSNISPLTNYYGSAPSAQPAHSTMSMFVCAPRDLRMNYPSPTPSSSRSPAPAPAPITSSQTVQTKLSRESKPNLSYTALLSSAKLSAYWTGEYHFDINILERHPYTTQTFTPLGLSPSDAEACYLVIVALSKPSPDPNPVPLSGRESEGGRGRSTESSLSNPPDLQHARAFLAHGGQAVTYAAGTWHAPMVVLGRKEVPFVVVQFRNGMGEEDCEEVVLTKSEAEDGMRDEQVGRGGWGGRGLSVLIRSIGHAGEASGTKGSML